MGFWDSIFGTNQQRPAPATPAAAQPARPANADQVAIERYKYLLRTAPPAVIEQVHAEAFAKLTPAQRAEVFRELAENAAPGEAPISDAPQALARSATRSEMRAPGTMQRAFSDTDAPANGAPTQRSAFGSALGGSIVGYVVASTVVASFLPGMGLFGGGFDDGGATSTDSSGDMGTDASGDMGGFGDFGGDFGF